MHDLIEQLNWRYAVKKFDSSKKLPEETYYKLIEALRLSASGFGLQPWKFINVINKDIRELLVEPAFGQRQVADASHLIVLARPIEFGKNDVERFIQSTATERDIDITTLDAYKKSMLDFFGTLSESDTGFWMIKQIFIALGTLLTSAAIEGVDSCPMGGFNPKEFDRILGLEEKGLTTVVLCPLGYRHADDYHADYKKVRFSKDELVIDIK